MLRLIDDEHARNWEGLVRFRDRGFLIATDELYGNWWPFIKRLVDSSTNTDATDNVTPMLTGLRFGGTDAYVTFGDAVPLRLATFTIETWFRRDGAGIATTT